MRTAIPSMTTFNPGLIVLLEFPNTDGAQGKPRPALVLLDSGDDDLLVARVTSQSQQSSYEVPIVEWKAAGLRLPSTARIHKLATMHKKKVRHIIGTLSEQDRKSVAAALNSAFGNW